VNLYQNDSNDPGLIPILITLSSTRLLITGGTQRSLPHSCYKG